MMMNNDKYNENKGDKNMNYHFNEIEDLSVRCYLVEREVSSLIASAQLPIYTAKAIIEKLNNSITQQYNQYMNDQIQQIAQKEAVNSETNSPTEGNDTEQ